MNGLLLRSKQCIYSALVLDDMTSIVMLAWLNRNRKMLATEVTRLKKSIEDAPMNRDQFIEMYAVALSYSSALSDTGFDR
jgi:hypothetical protein